MKNKMQLAKLILSNKITKSWRVKNHGESDTKYSQDEQHRTPVVAGCCVRMFILPGDKEGQLSPGGQGLPADGYHHYQNVADSNSTTSPTGTAALLSSKHVY